LAAWPGSTRHDDRLRGSKFWQYRRAGNHRRIHELQWGALRGIETRASAQELRIKPVHTPVNSPQSSGMAESFMNTSKHEYMGGMNRSSGTAALARRIQEFR
jgi:hypothetical protein